MELFSQICINFHRNNILPGSSSPWLWEHWAMSWSLQNVHDPSLIRRESDRKNKISYASATSIKGTWIGLVHRAHQLRKQHLSLSIIEGTENNTSRQHKTQFWPNVRMGEIQSWREYISYRDVNVGSSRAFKIQEPRLACHCIGNEFPRECEDCKNRQWSKSDKCRLTDMTWFVVPWWRIEFGTQNSALVQIWPQQLRTWRHLHNEPSNSMVIHKRVDPFLNCC
jgi:hypothetical protein